MLIRCAMLTNNRDKLLQKLVRRSHNVSGNSVAGFQVAGDTSGVAAQKIVLFVKGPEGPDSIKYQRVQLTYARLITY